MTQSAWLPTQKRHQLRNDGHKRIKLIRSLPSYAPDMKTGIEKGRRGDLQGNLAIGVVTAALAFFFMGSTLLTPLYALYERAFGFSRFVLTLIFAVYMIGNLCALLFLGRLSDEIGRRRATLFAFMVAGISTLLFSMGTGEVTRYIGKYGTKRMRKAVLIGTLGPYLVKTADNPEGIDRSVFDGIKAAIRADRPTFLMDLLHNFYNYDVTAGKLVSERVLDANWNVAAGASATGTVTCVDAWIEDFRQDIARNTVPTLILHGDADRILPADASSRRQAKMIKNVKFVELKDGPHGVLWTHAEQINAELVKFLA